MTNFPLDSYRESCRTESMVDAEMFGSGEGREGFEGSGDRIWEVHDGGEHEGNGIPPHENPMADDGHDSISSSQGQFLSRITFSSVAKSLLFLVGGFYVGVTVLSWLDVQSTLLMAYVSIIVAVGRVVVFVIKEVGLNDAVVRFSENEFVTLRDLLNAERQAPGGNILSISEDVLHITQHEVTVLKEMGRFCCLSSSLDRRDSVVSKLEILFLHISHYEANQCARNSDGLVGRFLPNPLPNVAAETMTNRNPRAELESFRDVVLLQTVVLWRYEKPQQNDIDDLFNKRMDFKTLFKEIPEHQRCQWLERQGLPPPYVRRVYPSIANIYCRKSTANEFCRKVLAFLMAIVSFLMAIVSIIGTHGRAVFYARREADINDAIVRFSDNEFVTLRELLHAESQALDGTILCVSEDALRIAQHEVTALKETGCSCYSFPSPYRRALVAAKLNILFLHISHYQANEYARNSDRLGERFLLGHVVIVDPLPPSNKEQLSELKSLRAKVRSMTLQLWHTKKPDQNKINDLRHMRTDFDELFKQIPEHRRCQLLQRPHLSPYDAVPPEDGILLYLRIRRYRSRYVYDTRR